MTIVLTILKIIGWMLLIALLLVLTVLLLVLFFPVGYRIRGDIHDRKINGSICVFWLFHLFSFNIAFQENKSSMYIRLFGVKKRLQTDETVDSSAKEQEYEPTQELADTVEEEERTSDFTKTDAPDSDRQEQKERGIGDTKAEDASSSAKEDTLFQKIKKKWKSFIHNIRRIKQMLNDTQNRAAFSHIRKELVCLLKCIMPGRLFLDLSYSAGSPDTTAYIFGILALFPIGYRNRWHIQPDFEAEQWYADGDIDAGGHIFIVSLVGILIRLLTDKNCRRLIRQLGNHKS